MDLINTRALEATVKQRLCEYYGLPHAASEIGISRANVTGLFGSRRHYVFTIRHGSTTYRAFGKVLGASNGPSCHSIYGDFRPGPATEYHNLRYLDGVHLNPRIAPKPIDLLQMPGGSICLLEYLDGYVNVSALLSSLVFRQQHLVRRMIAIGKLVLDGVYASQPALSRTEEGAPYSDLEALLTRLECVRSLSHDTKRRLASSVTTLVGAMPAARRGVIHADPGARNVLLSGTRPILVDWEAMQQDRYSLYDPCYFVLTLLMRGVQSHLSRARLAEIAASLSRYVIALETSLRPSATVDQVECSVLLGMRLAEIHVLSAYERNRSAGGLRAVMRQRARQIRVLADHVADACNVSP